MNDLSISINKPIKQFTTTNNSSPLVDKAIRQLSATGTFLKEIPVLDTNKTNFLNTRIQTALKDIRQAVDAQRKYDEQQLDETTKFSTKTRPDAESVAKEHADFIVNEVRKLLDNREIEVYEYRVVNPIDARLNKENIDLKDALKNKSAELEKAQFDIRALFTTITSLQTEKSKLELELKQLKTQYSSLETAKTTLETTLAQTQANLTQVTNDLTQSQVALTQSQVALAQAQFDLNKANSDLVQAQFDLNKVNSDLVQAKADLAQSQSALIQVQANLANNIAAKAIEINTLHQTIATKDQEIATKNQEIAQFKLDNMTLGNEKTTLEQEKTNLEQEKTTLEQEKTTLEQKKTALEKEKTTLEQKNATLEQEKTTLEQEKTTLEQKKTALEKEKTDLEKEKTDLDKKNATLEQEKTTLEQEIKSLKNIQILLTQSTEQLQADKKSLKEANAAAVKSVNDLTEIRNKKTEKTTAEINSLKQKLKELKKELKKAYQDLLDAKANNASAAHNIYSEEKTKLQEKIKTLTNALEENEKKFNLQLTNLQSKSPSTQTFDIQTTTDQIQKLTNEINKAQQNLKSEVDKTAETIKLNKKYESQISTLNDAIETLKTQLALKQQEYTKQTKILTDTLNKALQANKDLEKSKHDLEIAYQTEQNKLQDQIRTLSKNSTDIHGLTIPNDDEFNTIIKILNTLHNLESTNLEFETIESELINLSFTNKKADEIRHSLVNLLNFYSNTISALTNKINQLESIKQSPIPQIPIVSNEQNEIVNSLRAQIELLKTNEQTITKQLKDALERNNTLQSDIRTLTETNKSLTNTNNELNKKITSFRALQNNLLDLAHALGIKNEDDETKIISQITEKLSDSIEIVKQAQVYTSLNILFTETKETINASNEQIKNLLDLENNSFTEAAAETIESIEYHLKLINDQVNQSGKYLSDELKNQINQIKTELSNVKDAIEELSSDVGKSHDPVSVINSYNTLMNTLMEKLLSINKTDAINSIHSNLLKIQRDLTKKTEAYTNERTKAMQTVNTLTNQLISFLNEIVSNTTLDVNQIQLDLSKGLKPSDTPDSSTTIIDSYQEIESRWINLADILPATLNKILKVLNNKLQKVAHTKVFIQNITNKLHELGFVSDSQVDITNDNNADISLVDRILDKISQISSENTDLKKQMETYEQMNQTIQKLQKQIYRISSENNTLNGKLKYYEQMYASWEKGEFQKDLEMQAKMRNGIKPIDQQQTLRPTVESGVGGGYEPDIYTPIALATVSGLLWWGFGGLIIFLILIIIYLLGREIYKTQFKSETCKENILING